METILHYNDPKYGSNTHADAELRNQKYRFVPRYITFDQHFIPKLHKLKLMFCIILTSILFLWNIDIIKKRS